MKGVTVEVKIVGWRGGFKTVTFINLLMEYGGLSMSESKQMTDAVLDGKPESVFVLESRVNQFIEEAIKIGAVVNGR